VGVAALTAFVTLLWLGRGLTFGSGFEDLFWSMQIGFLIAIALGLGALILIRGSPSTSRAMVATELLDPALVERIRQDLVAQQAGH